ncbi:acyl-protein thioesterase 2-like isoform X2 [Gigantopelta aegis]|uniref:acyl-protein thioesterase 2-like isoform X2 n=1 Tax=Gigantopelta aegis TaxID=1735272 RepID=UPI001B88C197|nr:acyl-protein thioesterase 2-like isoform X2 [Gigantopelta aegis]
MGQTSSQTMSQPIVVAARAQHTASLIFLHGLGDTGHGWAEMFRALRLPAIKCVCPTAPHKPVTLNGGMHMPSWFDIKGLSPDAPEDENGVKEASNILKLLIEEEEHLGIPTNRVIIGGFSQGGAVALHTAFTYPKPLGGVVALSSWMPLHKQLISSNKYNTNIPMLQCHGTMDPLVSYKWGEKTKQLITSFNPNLTFKSFPMGHTTCEQEMECVKEFLSKF